jgi:23S rRNA (pseudouridine1915-N3)-methyltransferase
MRLAVLAAGKLRDAGLQALCDDYARRIRPYAALELTECRDLAALRAHWTRGDGPLVQVLLDERGEQPTTRGFADRLADWRDRGARVRLSIGDADGFTDADRAGADHLLALSRMTLPHRLVRLLVLEQLYRGLTLLAGHPYHRD